MNPSHAHILELPAAERLELIGELWDSLHSYVAEQPVAQWKLDELDRRRDLYLAGEAKTVTWDELKAEIHGRKTRVS